jgi:hypothetical protein
VSDETSSIVLLRDAGRGGLNTRPLSQPYINPSNPNAGDIGSRTNPSYRQTSPGTITNERQNPTMRPNACWRDSLGQTHCNRGQ